MKNTISVIVPIYNVAPYLPRCVESICAQSCQDLQIILVDDGSVDESGKLCDSYALQDKRIQVIHKKNGGLVTARKAGLDAATGDYVGFVDGDDYIEPSMYTELLRHIERTGADFVHSGFIQQNQGMETRFLDFQEATYELDENRLSFIEESLLGQKSDQCKNMTYSIWSKLFRREVISLCYAEVPDSQQYGEDVIALYACLLKCSRVSLKKEAYYHYVIRENSLSNIQSSAYLMKEFTLHQSLCNLLRDHDCYSELETLLDRRIQFLLMSYVDRLYEPYFVLSRYQYPNILELTGKKVVLWGAGRVGKDYYQQLCKYQSVDIVAWCDSHPERCHSEYHSIEGIEQLQRAEYDVIIVAVKKEAMAREIQSMLAGQGCSGDRIVWRAPIKIY